MTTCYRLLEQSWNFLSRFNIPVLMSLVLGLSLAAPLAATASSKQLDLNHPEEALKAQRKIQCSLVDGEPALYWWQGNVYSRIPGERDRNLFRIQGINIRACVTLPHKDGSYGYRLVSREVMLYLDPETHEILRRWNNPWTNKTVEVLHVANDPVNGKPRFANQPEGGFKLNGIFKGGKVITSFEVPLFYPNPLGGDYQTYVGGTYHAMEMVNFFVPEAELLDSTRNKINDVSISWARLSSWLPWMEMGDRVGLLVFHSAGLRLSHWDELPAVIRQEIETHLPQFRTPPPLDDTRPNETTWTNFKRQIDGN